MSLDTYWFSFDNPWNGPAKVCAMKKTAVTICVVTQTILSTVDATVSLCDAPQIVPVNAHHHTSGSQSTDGQTPFCVAISTHATQSMYN